MDKWGIALVGDKGFLIFYPFPHYFKDDVQATR